MSGKKNSVIWDFGQSVVKRVVHRCGVTARQVGAPAAFQEKGVSESWARREAIEVLVKLIGPMLPHLAEEIWQLLGYSPSITEATWPKPDPDLLSSETVTVAVQVNGKLRSTLTLAANLAADVAEEKALADPTIKTHIGERTIRKVIVIPNRVINVVI